MAPVWPLSVSHACTPSHLRPRPSKTTNNAPPCDLVHAHSLSTYFPFPLLTTIQSMSSSSVGRILRCGGSQFRLIDVRRIHKGGERLIDCIAPPRETGIVVRGLIYSSPRTIGGKECMAWHGCWGVGSLLWTPARGYIRGEIYVSSSASPPRACCMWAGLSRCAASRRRHYPCAGVCIVAPVKGSACMQTLTVESGMALLSTTASKD